MLCCGQVKPFPDPETDAAATGSPDLTRLFPDALNLVPFTTNRSVCALQALTLGREVAEVYAQAVTLLRGLGDTPVDPATLIGLDAAGLYQLNKVRACGRA